MEYDLCISNYHLGNVPFCSLILSQTIATNEDPLRQEFGHFGKATDIFLPMKSGTSHLQGFRFVTMATQSSAKEAICQMDQAQLDGRTICINESQPQGEGPSPS